MKPLSIRGRIIHSRTTVTQTRQLNEFTILHRTCVENPSGGFLTEIEIPCRNWSDLGERRPQQGNEVVCHGFPISVPYTTADGIQSSFRQLQTTCIEYI